MLGCEHELFGTILKNLQHEDIKELYDKISEIIDGTATHEKGAQKLAMQVRNNYCARKSLTFVYSILLLSNQA